MTRTFHPHPNFRASIQRVVKALKICYGPHARTICVDRGDSILHTTDGSSIVWELLGSSHVGSISTQLLGDACHQVSRKVGDGSTTCAILIDALLREGRKAIVGGEDPGDLSRRWLSWEPNLSPFAYEVEDVETLKLVAHHASHQDEAVASAVAEVVWEVGAQGVIEVCDGHGRDVTWKSAHGYKLDRGPMSPHFFHDDESVRILEIPLVALVEDILTETKHVQSLLEEASAHDRPLVIASQGLFGDALRTVLMNDRKLKGGHGNPVQWVGLKVEGGHPIFSDLASLSGAKVITNELGEFDPDWFGQVQQIEVRHKSSVWTCFETDEVYDRLEARVEALERLQRSSDFSGDRDALARRMAYLADGFLKLEVGGVTSLERKERKSRVEDSLRATQEALNTGLTYGGGAAYALVGETAPDPWLRRALWEPWSVITPEPVRSRYFERDLLSLGVPVDSIDVVGVVEEVLRTAISTSATLLNTSLALGAKK